MGISHETGPEVVIVNKQCAGQITNEEYGGRQNEFSISNLDTFYRDATQSAVLPRQGRSSASNNMQINKDKTKEMVITTSRTVSLPLLPDIERVDSFKLLGTVVSNDLKWNRHINYITHRVK